jgi:putative DNA primase/helicase
MSPSNQDKSTTPQDSLNTEDRTGSQEAGEDKRSIVQKTVDLLLDHAIEFIWDGDHAYLTLQEEGHVRTYAVGSKAFKHAVISKAMWAMQKPPTGGEQWAAVKLTIEAMARDNGTKPTPSIRVAGDSKVIYIDLGGDDWTRVKITAGGWTIEPHPADGPYFYRPPRMAALPTPEHGGAGHLDKLWRYLNATSESERMLLPAWIVNALWPRGPYPLLVDNGEHGSTKSTRCNVVKALTDPSIPSEDIPAVTVGRRLPREERSAVATARNARVISFDNVSYLPDWLPDFLCCLATGVEMGSRGLYTDFDEEVFATTRPVIINGIPDVIGQSDLADRTVRTRSTKAENPMSEEVFWDQFRQDWPGLLGVVFDLVSAVLQHWDEVGEVTEDVRMRNFARIGKALGVELGWEPGKFVKVYADNCAEAAAEVLQSNVIYAPLIALLDARGGEWSGTMALLLTDLSPYAEGATQGANWPTGKPKALGNTLTRMAPALLAEDITVESGKSNGALIRTIRRI